MLASTVLGHPPVAELYRKSQEAQSGLLSLENELGFTFLSAAETEATSDRAHWESALANVRTALETIRHLQGRIEDPQIRQTIQNRADNLERGRNDSAILNALLGCCWMLVGSSLLEAEEVSVGPAGLSGHQLAAECRESSENRAGSGKISAGSSKPSSGGTKKPQPPATEYLSPRKEEPGLTETGPGDTPHALWLIRTVGPGFHPHRSAPRNDLLSLPCWLRPTGYWW